jgi:hypothetical protein
VAFRGTKVLPSASASVRALAGSRATMEISTSIPRFHSSRFNQQLRAISQSVPPAPPGNQRRRFSGVDKDLARFKLHGGTCRQPMDCCQTDSLRTTSPATEHYLEQKQERAALVAILNDYVRAHFPEYVKSHSGTGSCRSARILAGII